MHILHTYVERHAYLLKKQHLTSIQCVKEKIKSFRPLPMIFRNSMLHGTMTLDIRLGDLLSPVMAASARIAELDALCRG